MTNTGNYEYEIYDYTGEDACGMVANADGYTAYVQATGDQYMVIIEQPNGTYTCTLVMYDNYRQAITAAMDEVGA